MKIYLAGPMTGYDQYNFPAFDEYARKLRLLGHSVWNPADNDRQNGFDPTLGVDAVPHFTLAECMADDLRAVCLADAVAVMPGWRESRGVNLEVYVARYLGIKVLDADTLEEVE